MTFTIRCVAQFGTALDHAKRQVRLVLPYVAGMTVAVPVESPNRFAPIHFFSFLFSNPYTRSKKQISVIAPSRMPMKTAINGPNRMMISHVLIRDSFVRGTSTIDVP